MLSIDGQVWSHDEQYDTLLVPNSDEVKVIRLKTDGTAIAARFVRVIPVSWFGADGTVYSSDGAGSGKVGAAMRVGLLATAIAKYAAPSIKHFTLESANSEGLTRFRASFTLSFVVIFEYLNRLGGKSGGQQGAGSFECAL